LVESTKLINAGPG